MAETDFFIHTPRKNLKRIRGGHIRREGVEVSPAQSRASPSIQRILRFKLCAENMRSQVGSERWMIQLAKPAHFAADLVFRILNSGLGRVT